MAWEFNTELIIKILEEADFDASESGTINAVKEIDGLNHQLYINSKGRIRYQYSRVIDQNYKKIKLIGKQFGFDKENRDIVNVIGQLESIDELIEFLREINTVFGGER